MTTETTGAAPAVADDFAAFETSRTAAPTPAAPEPEPAPEPAPAAEETDLVEVTTTEEIPADESSEEPRGDGPKPKKTAQQRIDELTWRANEAERREKATLERLEQALKGQSPTPAPEPQAAASDEAPPNPEDYEFGDTDAQFIRELAQFETRKVLNEQRQADQREQAIATSLQGYNARLTEQFPDGHTEAQQAFYAADKPVLVQLLTMDSEVGPKMADHYGSNPTELARLSALPAHLQAYEFGKTEARFVAERAAAAAAAASAAQEPAPKPPAKTVTDAPEPAPRARGAGGQFKVDGNTSDFAAFEGQYGR